VSGLSIGLSIGLSAGLSIGLSAGLSLCRLDVRGAVVSPGAATDRGAVPSDSCPGVTVGAGAGEELGAWRGDPSTGTAGPGTSASMSGGTTKPSAKRAIAHKRLRPSSELSTSPHGRAVAW
jgi:hypothetical protein